MRHLFNHITFVALCLQSLLSSSGARAQTNFWELTSLDSIDVRNIIATKGGNIFGADGNCNTGLYFSSDDGSTWAKIDSGLPHVYWSPTLYQSMNCLAVDSSGVIYAGSSVGVHQSMNNGITWTQPDSGLPSAWVSSLVVTPSGYILAGSDSGVYRTTDQCTTWQPVNTALRGVYSFAVSKSGNVFAGSGYGLGLFRSTDDGSSWSHVTGGGSFPFYTYVGALLVSPAGWLYAGTEYYGIYRSTDEGASWRAINTGLLENDIVALSCASSGQLFLAAPGTGVYTSKDSGTTWLQIEEGLLDSPRGMGNAIMSAGLPSLVTAMFLLELGTAAIQSTAWGFVVVFTA